MKRKPKQKSQIDAFTISNHIVELPKTDERTFTGSKGGARIINRGADNKLPYFLADIVNNSSTLKSVINSKSDYVSYGDLVIDNDQILDKLKNNLNKDYGYHELLKKVSKDRFTFGYGVIMEVKKGGQQFFWHIDASKIAYSYDKDAEEPESVWISEDWNDLNKPKNKPYEVSLFPQYTKFEDGERRIIIIKDYAPAEKDYPLPMWSGAIYDAQVESLIGQYNSGVFENGVTLSSILMFDFGHITDDKDLEKQKKKLELKIKGTSGQRAGKSLIVPKSGDVEKPEYVTYPMDKEGSYLNLQKLVENNIVKANSWFRSLAGLESAGTLGNNQQLKNEWQLAERLISNEQHRILDKILLALDVEVEYSFNNASPFELMNDFAKVIDVVKALNTDEIKTNQATGLLKLMGLNDNEINDLIE